MPNRLDAMAKAFQDELEKIANAKHAGVLRKAAPAVAAGALGWETLRRANEDRKLGRQVRKQQNPGLLS
jgi:hypothetical protein